MDTEKRFNLYWGGTGRLSTGSPHRQKYVIDELFCDALSEATAAEIDALGVGEKHVDPDGDTWERIA